MDTTKLKKFAQFARRTLIAQVSAKLDSVLAPGAAARREHPEAMKKLDAAVARDGKGQVIERVAYTWFNRFSALRYMDVNDLNPVRVVSPLTGQFQPEILAEAKAGNINEERIPEKIRAKVSALLDGRAPSSDAQAEAYRLVLVAICNDWHRVMPFLFERIDDYTELLLPEDLLSNASILAYLREAMTPDVCEDVEVIGWLYQFYISEKKDEVFAGLKKNVKITAENIPAATQLFTPHWIVRYLVENSLGRLWMLNRPGSRLKERMDYYIAPDEPETDFLRISSPEEIRVCDPACGSGHMLTYAFDLLYAIYEEEGYDAAEIPGLILANNLYGIEIDERAGALAAFALSMKAAARRKRFLRRSDKGGERPNICILENVSFTDNELIEYVKKVGRDVFTADLRETLGQFQEAKNFGSLIIAKLKDAREARRILATKSFEGDMLYGDVHARVETVLCMTDYLTSKYHIVVANPPYMGSGGMNPSLSRFAKEDYPDSKSDLFAMFIERSAKMSIPFGMAALVTIQNWMFISSFENLRHMILERLHLTTLLQIGFNSFPQLNSKVVQAAAFVLTNSHNSTPGYYINANNAAQSANKSEVFGERLRAGEVIRASDSDFKKIPGSPIAYWLSKRVFEIFESFPSLARVAPTKQGLATGDNDRFLRMWQEPSISRVGFGCSSSKETSERPEKWFPCNKGGDFRKWYGNNTIVVNWKDSGREIKSFKEPGGKLRSRPQNEEFYFKPGLTWSAISSGGLSMRLSPLGAMFETKGAMCFPLKTDIHALLAFSNTKIVNRLLLALSPTLDFHEGPVGRLPYNPAIGSTAIGQKCASLAREDWDASETSWDFSTLPLLSLVDRRETVREAYASLRIHWDGMTQETQRLEEENNRIFIDAYGLQDELTPEVPIEEITLTCNPAYRYAGQRADADLETLLLADTMRELVSYAVGCMFGRYSLNEPGLILANLGEGLEDYRAKVQNATFEPDADNVIPVLEGAWFADDVAARFRRFLRVTFGEEHFQENLAFIEHALGKDVRRYFTRDFFNDHVKRYKKRPIYWLFSSPKGTFNALIYMHRYRPDTVSVVLNNYLREFRGKLESHRRAQEALSISGDASPAQKTKALKEIEATARQIEEIDAWERDVLFPLATQKIEIDLDDGVKANYPRFGAALKPIKGLNDSDD